jgi:hypothetical protein
MAALAELDAATGRMGMVCVSRAYCEICCAAVPIVEASAAYIRWLEAETKSV